MTIETMCWQSMMRQAIACTLLVIACGGCRSYMVALEYDQGKCDVFEAVFGNCNDRCQQCSRSECAGCDQNGMAVFYEEPPFMPAGQPTMESGGGDFAMGPSAGPPIRSAAFTDELPATLFLPVPVRPVFAPRQPMALTVWED